MNDEIREILDKLKDNDWYDELDLTGDKWIELKQTETKQILDYITILQKENEELKKNQRYYKNGVFSLEYDKETLSDMVDDYKSRVEKAVEYITSYQKIRTVKVGDKHIVHCCLDLIGDEYIKLLNILQNGGDKDE